MINATAISAAAPLQEAAAALATSPQRPGTASPSSPRAAAPRAGSAAGTGPAPKAGSARAAARTATAQAAAKTGTTSTTSKTSTTRTAAAASSTTSAKTGYATVKLPKEFAFLNDPKISIEEKLSRFIGLMMTRSEQRLQEQMEKMAAGSTGAADGASSSSASKTASSGSSGKSGFSLWGIAKALLPPLGMASSLLGDSTVKSLVGEVTGPVLAAAATACGLPELAPFALKLGPQVASFVTSDVAIPFLDGGAASGTARGAASGGRPAAPTRTDGDAAGDGGTTSATGSTSKTSSSSSSGTTSVKVAATEGSTSEKAQLLELQRLQDQDKELFALFSNMLKAIHDARMTAIQNIR